MNLQKLPDSARGQLAQVIEPIPGLGFEAAASSEKLTLADRWIFSRLLGVTREMNEALASYRFHEAAHTIYHFFWHEFCDWYLEWVKPEISQAVQGTRVPPHWINLVRVFEVALHLLHPFMPFITEELWHQLPRARRGSSISLTSFQLVSERVADPVSENQFRVIEELVVAARNAKAEMGLHTEKPSAQVSSQDLRTLETFRAHQETVRRLAGLEALNFTQQPLTAEASGIRHVGAGVDLRLFHEKIIDPTAERARLGRERARLEQQLNQLEKQLQNDGFRRRAPQEVVRATERRRGELSQQHTKIVESLQKIESAG
jgi:valyl-tRNA synthetase